jgi:HK97 family phage prohead protease
MTQPELVAKGLTMSAESKLEFRVAAFEYKFTENSPTTQGQFEGYAAVFNNQDDGGDLILPGAFTKSLADHVAAGTMPKMFLNHAGLGSDMMSTSPGDLLPVGKWSSMSEDAHGLAGKGRLINLDSERGKMIYGAMKENAIDGLSIAFPRLKSDEFKRSTRPGEPARTINQIRLLEAGPVTFPMNGQATITSIKSMDFADLKEAEDLLRDAAGFSRSEAKHFISSIKAFGLRDAGSDDEVKRAIAAMSRRAAILKL